MGDYSMPESIRKFKPKGTMVKRINGRYYVYEYSTVAGFDGKRHTQMGQEIGKIEEGIGFIPKETFLCNSEITDLNDRICRDIGQFTETLVFLKEYFNPLDATTIYTVAAIHFIHGFTHQPSIGLLLCKNKNNLVAEYALKEMSKPMRVSE